MESLFPGHVRQDCGGEGEAGEDGGEGVRRLCAEEERLRCCPGSRHSCGPCRVGNFHGSGRWQAPALQACECRRRGSCTSRGFLATKAFSLSLSLSLYPSLSVFCPRSLTSLSLSHRHRHMHRHSHRHRQAEGTGVGICIGIGQGVCAGSGVRIGIG
jgi:hypothetical protein